MINFCHVDSSGRQVMGIEISEKYT